MMVVVAIGSFLLLVVVAYLIARPLFAPDAGEEESQGSSLLDEKQRLLADIRELDMDFATGKLSEDDYRKLRARATAEAAATIRAIDESTEGAPGEPEVVQAAGLGPDGDGAASPASLDEEIEREIAARKRTLEEHGCPGCGALVEPRDRFCRVCGARLEAVETG